mgnify:CR=1 FL=1
MPSRNIIKTYVQGGIYHLYNRGVEKRIIFLDHKDYTVFLGILKEALSPPDLQGETLVISRPAWRKKPKNFSSTIALLGFCLMPNHIHLLVKQTELHTIKEFMQSILTRYSMYFNKRYKRTGSLFQNCYKAALVSDDPYLLALTRYIHRNPLTHTKDMTTAYSSYPYYLGLKHAPWVDTATILSYFQSDPIKKTKHKDYQSFVQWDKETDTLDAGLTLEDEEED